VSFIFRTAASRSLCGRPPLPGRVRLGWLGQSSDLNDIQDITGGVSEPAAPPNYGATSVYALGPISGPAAIVPPPNVSNAAAISTLPASILAPTTPAALTAENVAAVPAPTTSLASIGSSLQALLTQSTLVSGVPDSVVVGGGALGLVLLVSLFSGKKKRRRQ
jgi:hypothetical protein